MKSLFFLPVLVFSSILFIGQDIGQLIDPTGTYTLTGTVKKNRVVSHYGEIRVLLLSSDRVALCFYINKGYPGYESGAILDTLPYVENKARFTASADSSCTIIFTFTGKTAEIAQLYTDPHSGCGFAAGVLTAASFQKTSDEKPLIQDLSAHGISQ